MTRPHRRWRLSLLAALSAAVACLGQEHVLVGKRCDSERSCGDDLYCVRGTCALAPEAAEPDGGAGPAHSDSGTDGSADFGIDGGADSGADAGFDSGSDSGVDSGISIDAGHDEDAGADAGLAPDAGAEHDAGQTTPDASVLPNLLTNGGFETTAPWYEPATEGSTVERVQEVAHSGTYSLRVLGSSGTTSGFVYMQLEHRYLQPIQTNRTYCVEVWVRNGPIIRDLHLALRSDNSSGGKVETPDMPGSYATPPAGSWSRLRAQTRVTAPYDYAFSFQVFARTPPDADFYVDDARVWTVDGSDCDAL